MKRGQRVALLLLPAVIAAGAGTGSAGSKDATVDATVVNVTVKEFSLKPAKKLVAPGKVTFAVRNVGKVDHELVVLRTNRPAKRLFLESHGDVYEVGRIGKISPIDASSTKSLTLTLIPGHYALICNLPGHYRAGQYSDFAVG